MERVKKTVEVEQVCIGRDEFVRIASKATSKVAKEMDNLEIVMLLGAAISAEIMAAIFINEEEK